MSTKNAPRLYRSAFFVCAVIKPWGNREAFTALRLTKEEVSILNSHEREGIEQYPVVGHCLYSLTIAF